MKTRALIGVAALLLVVIVVLVWLLVALPTPVHAPTTEESGTSTTTASAGGSQASAPLHERVVVDAPRPNATVSHALAISGEAPGNWYFEAVFPIKVTTPAGDTIGSGVAQAQSDWMTTAQVPFAATITLDPSYSGPATIALLRDNPSGLPENDDSLEIPIIVQ